MTGDDSADEPPVNADDSGQDRNGTANDESKPEIPSEQQVDVDLDAVDESIDDEDDEAAADGDESDGTTGTAGNDRAASSDASRARPAEGYNWGEHYVRGLTAVSNAAVDRYAGEDGTDVSADMAFELEIDRALNDWLREHDIQEDMPPGQAVLVGTLFFLIATVAMNAEVADGLMGDLEGVLG